MQWSGFMSIELEQRLIPCRVVPGHGPRRRQSAEAHRGFYDEYMSVMDLPAEFYLQTIAGVRSIRARRQAVSRGRPVDAGAIRRTALLTVEGERDDICAAGQMSGGPRAAHRLPARQAPAAFAAQVGHYGSSMAAAGRGDPTHVRNGSAPRRPRRRGHPRSGGANR